MLCNTVKAFGCHRQENGIHGKEFTCHCKEPAASFFDGNDTLLLIIKQSESVKECIRNPHQSQLVTHTEDKPVDAVIVVDVIGDTGKTRLQVRACQRKEYESILPILPYLDDIVFKVFYLLVLERKKYAIQTVGTDKPP